MKGARRPTGARILNVEDYPPSRYVRTKVLREAGFEVTEADCAAAAIRALHDEKVSLVLLDMNLPDGTGAELCRKIRKEGPVKELPVLIISSTARGELDRLEGVRSGANMYLTEPVPPEQLLATIDTLLTPKTPQK